MFWKLSLKGALPECLTYGVLFAMHNVLYAIFVLDCETDDEVSFDECHFPFSGLSTMSQCIKIYIVTMLRIVR